jgi:hypothetical protein
MGAAISVMPTHRGWRVECQGPAWYGKTDDYGMKIARMKCTCIFSRRPHLLGFDHAKLTFDTAAVTFD